MPNLPQGLWQFGLDQPSYPGQGWPRRRCTASLAPPYKMPGDSPDAVTANTPLPKCVCVHGGGRHWAQPRADPLAITRSHRCCLWPWPWSLSQSQRESSSSSCPHPPSSLYPRTTSQLRAGGKNPKNILRISLLGTYHKDRVHRKKNAKSLKMFSAALLLLLRLVVARGDTHRHAETETPSPAVPPPARTFDRRTV